MHAHDLETAALASPGKALAGVQGMPDLALPVVVLGDQPGAAGALVGDATPALACPVYLHMRRESCSAAP